MRFGLLFLMSESMYLLSAGESYVLKKLEVNDAGLTVDVASSYTRLRVVGILAAICFHSSGIHKPRMVWVFQ